MNTKEKYAEWIKNRKINYEFNLPNLSDFIFEELDNISKTGTAVTKTFALPDDKYQLEVNNQDKNMYFAIIEFKEWLRNEIKYNDREDLEFVRDAFNDILNEHNFIEVNE